MTTFYQSPLCSPKRLPCCFNRAHLAPTPPSLLHPPSQQSLSSNSQAFPSLNLAVSLEGDFGPSMPRILSSSFAAGNRRPRDCQVARFAFRMAGGNTENIQLWDLEVALFLNLGFLLNAWHRGFLFLGEFLDQKVLPWRRVEGMGLTKPPLLVDSGRSMILFLLSHKASIWCYVRHKNCTR